MSPRIMKFALTLFLILSNLLVGAAFAHSKANTVFKSITLRSQICMIYL